MKELLAFALWLTFYRESDCALRYVEAVAAVTQDRAEGRVLVLLAKHENFLHCGSHEAPFGLSDWRVAHRRLPSIEEAAPIALRGVRSLLRRCGTVDAALGHWHHGTQAPRHGCWSDWLSTWEASSLAAWRWSDEGGANPTRVPLGMPARRAP